MQTKRKQRVQAWAIRAAREWTFGRDTGPARQRCADAMTEATGELWSANVIRNMELGTRRIDAELLPVLARVLEVPESFLLHGLASFDPTPPEMTPRRTPSTCTVETPADLALLAA